MEGNGMNKIIERTARRKLRILSAHVAWIQAAKHMLDPVAILEEDQETQGHVDLAKHNLERALARLEEIIHTRFIDSPEA
jgi:hypothetical protein